MSKRKIKKADDSNQFPQWYWEHGLHDAEILSISELELEPDWKSQNRHYNCFEITLDAKGALFETDIKKIRFYNYKLKSDPIDISSLKAVWWLQDTLTQISDTRYNLHLVLEGVKRHHFFIDINFESADVERK